MKITFADIFKGSNATDRVRVETDRSGAKIYLNSGRFPREDNYIMLHPYHIKDLYKEIKDE